MFPLTDPFIRGRTPALLCFSLVTVPSASLWISLHARHKTDYLPSLHHVLLPLSLWLTHSVFSLTAAGKGWSDRMTGCHDELISENFKWLHQVVSNCTKWKTGSSSALLFYLKIVPSLGRLCEWLQDTCQGGGDEGREWDKLVSSLVLGYIKEVHFSILAAYPRVLQLLQRPRVGSWNWVFAKVRLIWCVYEFHHEHLYDRICVEIFLSQLLSPC